MNKIEYKLEVEPDLNLIINIHEVGSPLWMIVVHGLGEHQGRHNHLFQLLGEDVNIATFDLRGHGLSDGKRADIEDFSYYVNDLEKVILYLQKNYDLKEYILFGHSMGGLVATRFSQSSFSLAPKALFLSSPALGITGVAKKIFSLLPDSFLTKLSKMKQGVYLKGVLDLKKLSHHKLVYTDYVKDPLCSLKTNSRLLLKIADESIIAQQEAKNVKIPTFGVIGSCDSLVDVESCSVFFDKIQMSQNLKIIQGAYHEIHNEIPDYKNQYIPFLKKVILSYRYNEYS